MRRTATVYVQGPGEVPGRIRHLLNSHGVAFISVEVGEHSDTRALLLRKADARDLPVVEFDGTFTAGVDMENMARALGLPDPRRSSMPICAYD